MSNSDILVLGKIQGTRGIRGDLKVYRRGDLLESFKPNSTLELYSAKGIKDGFLIEPEFYGEQIVQGISDLTPDTVQLRCKGLNNADNAWNLKGLFIGIKLADAKKKFHNPGDPFLFEFLDLQILEGNEPRGRVKRVEEYNNKQWLIGEYNETEVMIPLQGPYIENIDFNQGVIHIIQDSGLFATNEPA